MNKTVVFWGTFDKGKPRVRLLIKALEAKGVKVIECHVPVWDGIEDKSQFTGFLNILKKILAILTAYPKLIYRYWKLPVHDAVIISYLGQFDVLVFWPISKLKKVPVIWDVFISLYDTIVVDRQIVTEKTFFARVIYIVEWIGLRSANKIFMDTKSHARYLEDLYYLKKDSVERVLVGAEIDKFYPSKKKSKNNSFTIMFYGQFIPLHGIDVIVNAACIMEQKGITLSWIIIGKGQEEKRIDKVIEKLSLKSVHRISWVPYDELVDYIGKADVCLGIFSNQGKALRVIPNKVFQILCAGKPLITSDTPAIRELLNETELIRLIKPGNSEELANAVLEMKERLGGIHLLPKAVCIGPDVIGNQLMEVFDKLKI